MKVLLIVDDETFARQAVADTIEWKEYDIQVYQVDSGKKALEFMDNCEVDILMTDIRMPFMTGLELLEKVYQKGWNPRTIVLSSFNEFELVRSAMQLGAEDYLFKPTMMPEDILESVLRVLEKKRETEKNIFGNISQREIFRKFLLGEKVQKSNYKVSEKQWRQWDEQEFLVISAQLLKYQECLTHVFGNDLNLMQFSIGNVLQEVMGNVCECFVFRLNHKEFAIVCNKTNALENENIFYEKIYNGLNSGVTFLNLYYQMKVVVGISNLEKGLERLANKYAEAAELCLKANVDLYNNIQFSGSVNISGCMKREMLRALQYIGENLGNKELSLQMISDRIGVSKNYFSKMFKESMGIGFVDYITRQRMEQARNLYLNSDLKIYEIAELVGYSDWHYLYNLYKKIYGHSLSKEKEQQKNKM